MMWKHYCEAERAWLGFEEGCSCDWCGATEQSEAERLKRIRDARLKLLQRSPDVEPRIPLVASAP